MMRGALRRHRHELAAALLGALVIGAAASFGSWYMARDERLGVLHFPISCGWQSERDFTTATALLHLFQFVEAEAAYRALARRDPDCAIAYWGIAMSRFKNPLYAIPDADDVAVARTALARAEAAATANAHERGYLSAVATLFAAEGGRREHEERYAEAMARLLREDPQDKEAAIFYALALNMTADVSHANRTRAAELLLATFAEEPDHPGIDHYLTYCLGHTGYQPKPFARAPMSNPAQRILLAALAFVALSGAGALVLRTADLSPGASASDAIGGPFALTAADGGVVNDRSYRGRWLLVYFGYTRCPGICPATLTAVAEVMKQLGPLAAQLQPVFISIDPERDTPDAVGAFTRAFDPRILGLTGTPSEIAAVAKEYRVFYKKLPGPDPETYLMEHSPYLYLIGPVGNYVTLFTEDQVEAPDEVAARLRELLGPRT
jgi:protein SCO1